MDDQLENKIYEGDNLIKEVDILRNENATLIESMQDFEKEIKLMKVEMKMAEIKVDINKIDVEFDKISAQAQEISKLRWIIILICAALFLIILYICIHPFFIYFPKLVLHIYDFPVLSSIFSILKLFMNF